MVYTIIIIVLAVTAVVFWWKNMRLYLPSIALFTGGVKVGKSTVGIYVAMKEHKKALIKWHIRKMLGKKEPKPLLYSNIPLKHKYYTELKEEHILRKEKIIDHSVVYIDEISLLADSMQWKARTLEEHDINEEMKMFFKLFGHECNGKLIATTHTPKDVHYNFKRSLSNYIWLHSSIKFLPFIYIARAKEMLYTDEVSTNVVNGSEEIVEQTKWVIVPKKVWKKFDFRCYSILTDSLPQNARATKAKTLKQDKVLTIKGEKKCKKQNTEK